MRRPRHTFHREPDLPAQWFLCNDAVMAKRTNRRAAQHQSHAAVPQRPKTSIERWSAPVLLRLHGMPRWLFPGFTALLLLGGLLVSSPVLSTLLLGVLTLLLMWLVALSWQLLSSAARLMRLLVLGGLLMVAYGRATGAM